MTETNVYQRVRILVKHQKQNSKSLAEAFEMQQTTVWNYLNDRTKMSGEFIERVLALFPDASAEWVMRGEGRMYHAGHYATAEATETEAAPEAVAAPNGQGELVAALRKTIAAQETAIEAQNTTIAELKKRCATLEAAAAEKQKNGTNNPTKR